MCVHNVYLSKGIDKSCINVKTQIFCPNEGLILSALLKLNPLKALLEQFSRVHNNTLKISPDSSGMHSKEYAYSGGKRETVDLWLVHCHIETVQYSKESIKYICFSK